jgi:hypothetical protein
MTGKSPDSCDPGTSSEQSLKEPPAIRWRADQIQGELPERHTLDTHCPIRDERFPQLAPAARGTNINECPQAGLPKVEHIPRGRRLDLGQQSNGGNSRKLPDKLRYFRCF